MKGFRLILTMLIAMTFAFGTIACDKKEPEATPSTAAAEPATEEPAAEEPAAEEPAAAAGTAAQELKEAPAPEGATNGEEPAEGAESQ